MILGVNGLRLSADEKAFFGDERPWGFILFARNLSESEQVRDLAAAVRECVGRPEAPIFIDQEGGRVQRLRPPLAPNYPDAAAIGALYTREPEAGLRASWLMGRLHAFELTRHDLSANCFPVLDVPSEGAHDVIGDRAFAHEPDAVAALGRAAADGLMAGGILPVMKHIPGHGRAGVDSHKALPRVDAPLKELHDWDFAPFRALSDLPMAMTAHVVYADIDSENPSTTSRRVIRDVIRGQIGFDGLLMSDDVSMHALSGDFSARASAILAAGCDLVLHCTGVMAEMQAIAERAPELCGKSFERAASALAARRQADGADEDQARAEFARLLDCPEVAA